MGGAFYGGIYGLEFVILGNTRMNGVRVVKTGRNLGVICWVLGSHSIESVLNIQFVVRPHATKQ